MPKPFRPHRTPDQEGRFLVIENALTALSATVANLNAPTQGAKNTGASALVAVASGGSGSGGGSGITVLAGDVTGPAAATTVAALQSFTLTITAPVTGDVLTWDGSEWVNTQVAQPTVFKQASATSSGSTALWTPASGKKFVLMRYMVTVTEEATLGAAADLTISLLDAAADIGQNHILYVPNAAFGGIGEAYTSPWIDLGTTGITSAAINQVLNINLSAALTAGKCNVIACGIEV